MNAVEKVRTLEECEANIERCLKSFWELGEEYRYIRDNDLYKQTHSRWASYCKERWGLDRSTVDAAVRATEIRARLSAQSGVGPPHSLPSNVEQTKPLSTLPEEEQVPAWEEAVEEAQANGKEQPTHEDVKRVVERRRAPTRPPMRTPADHAYEAARTMRQRAEGFVSAVDLLMPHLNNLSEDEIQGSAYKIVETVHAVMHTLEEHGHIRGDVARAVIGQPEEGMVEVAS